MKPKTLILYIILLIFSPVFWWQFKSANYKNIYSLWKQTPQFISQKVNNLYSDQNIDIIKQLRRLPDNKIDRLFYNKATLIGRDLMTALTLTKPQIHFYAGTGGSDSPPNIEPIPIILLPFAILGMVNLIKNKKYTFLILWLASAIPAQIVDQYNYAFLFPTALFYIYFSTIYISKLKKPYYFIIFYILYSFYLFKRHQLFI